MSAPAISFDAAASRRMAEHLTRLAPLVEYPSETSLGEALRCRDALAPDAPDAAAAIGRFAAWLANEPVETHEEVYTRTFLVAPSYVPYVGIHLFGDESFRRGRLMAELRDAFDRVAFHAGDELPDHLAILLRFATRLPEDERHELVRYLLDRPVAAMIERLGRAKNPYFHALEAVRTLLGAWGSETD